MSSRIAVGLITALACLPVRAASTDPASTRRDQGSAAAAPRGRIVASRVPLDLRTPYDEELDEARLDPPQALVGWDVVRLERDGDRVAAITSGRFRDPARPDGLPCYRLHLSRDGGLHFDEPAWLGVGELTPFLVRSRSKLPLIVGRHVNVEALRCRRLPTERDDWMTEWPCDEEPVAVMLTYDLDELALDSDGDGLSDRQEEWCFLDPHHADSDGDAVPDGADEVPRVPPASRPLELGRFLEWLVRLDPKQVSSSSLEERAASTATAGPPPSAPQETLWLVQVDRVPFFRQAWMQQPVPEPPYGSTRRVLVLSDAEARRRGVTTATGAVVKVKISIGQSGRTARLDVDRGGEGGEYVATLGESGWTLTGVMYWVE